MTANSLTLTLETENNLLPRDLPAQRVLEIRVQAPAARQARQRLPLNLALVLDRSGSMSGAKLDYVKQAAAHVADLLEDPDRVALVIYDNEIEVLSESALVTSAARDELKRRIAKIEAGNMTNLSGGWLAGCQQVAAGQRGGQVDRALLLTDGLANEGITDLEELARHARELSARGVSTSTFGVGEGFNEHLLEAMANQGGGSFYYIASPKEIPGIFEREFHELAEVTAREVEIVLDFPRGLDVQVLGGWRSERSSERMHIYLGSLQAGRSQAIYANLLLPPSGQAEKLAFSARVMARGDDGGVIESQAELTFTYADEKALKAVQPKRDVLERCAAVRLSDEANEALKLEREGQRDKASQRMQVAVAAAAPYMSPKQAESYRGLANKLERGLNEAERKATHYDNYQTRRGRNEPEDKTDQKA